jgi:hypothetical protein
MKKGIIIIFILFLGSNISFGIGLPHRYAKKKKIDRVEVAKKIYKVETNLLFPAKISTFVLLKYFQLTR